jgi:queuine tRNA-ribosyltransferase
LIKAGEVLGIRLTTIHNLRFVFNLMEEIKAAIRGGNMSEFRDKFLETYQDV